MVPNHLFGAGQFQGLSGSSGLSQSRGPAAGFSMPPPSSGLDGSELLCSDGDFADSAAIFSESIPNFNFFPVAFGSQLSEISAKAKLVAHVP